MMTEVNKAPDGAMRAQEPMAGAGVHSESPSFRPAVRAVARSMPIGGKPGRRSATVISQRPLVESQGIYELVVRDVYTATHAQPAQFVNLYPMDSFSLLPRPFGVAGVDGDEVTLIYRVVGTGTKEFSRLKAGGRVGLFGPLGNPFDISSPAGYVLVGGGLGIPPLLYAAQRLAHRSDSSVTTAFGYRDEHFADGHVTRLIGADRMHGISDREGNVVDLLNRMEPMIVGNDRRLPPVILSCGPMPMMKAVAHWAGSRGIATQLSLEARMGCGYGACVGCVVDTPHGRLEVCRDGPVFNAERLGWTA